MKIVIVGLTSLLISCAYWPQPVVQNNINPIALSDLAQNSEFINTKDDQFVFKNKERLNLKIFEYKFKKSQDAEFYLQNRKMLLHQTFQNNIAPYFGVIEANPICYSRAQVEAVDQDLNESTRYFYMVLPVTKNLVVSDCLKDETWGLVKYEFFYCKKNNSIFELRNYNPLGQKTASYVVTCY